MINHTVETESLVVTRFAPSPTGYLHVGGLRTALYSYLIAKQSKGEFLLRIEDTDRERFVADGTKNILDSLYWAQIPPDAGVVLDGVGDISQKGNNGPYIQSERLGIYKHYVDLLIAQKHAYHCFCTHERLEQLRITQMAQKQTPRYDRHCAGLSDTEVSRRLDAGERSVVRMRMPDTGVTTFTDLIRGEVSFQNTDIDDQVILKSDRFPTYHLAVVVDDHLMQVTHVVRGEEWISSTPKHITLYNFFGWKSPQFAHLPLLLNSDKSKLSKRQGDVAVKDYATKGYLPEALINFVAFLGWNPGTEQELFSLDELVDVFDIGKINKSGAVFNVEKLDWYNREYIKRMNVNDQFDEIKKRIMHIPGYCDEVLWRVLGTIIERVTKWSDIDGMVNAGEIQFFWTDPVIDPHMLAWKADTAESARTHLQNMYTLLEDLEFWDVESIRGLVMSYADQHGRGNVLWPLRVALSGREKSPDPFTILFGVGRDVALRRILSASRLQ